MDWMDIALLVSLCIVVVGLVCFAIFVINIRFHEKKKEKMRKEANQKDFMDEEIDKSKTDEIGKE